MGRRLCCCRPCEILTINGFEEEAVPSSLEVMSGSWSGGHGNDNNELKEDGTVGAVIVSDAPIYVVSHGDMTVNADLELKPGTKHRIIVNYIPPPGESYKYLEVDQAAAKWRLGHSSSGTLIEDDLNQTSGTLSAKLCINHFGLLYGELIDQQWLHTGTGFSSSGRRGGLGNGGTTAANFVSFQLLDHLYHAVGCPRCMCHCDGEVPPQTLTSTFWNVSDCEDLDGFEISWSVDHTQDQLVYLPNDQNMTCGPYGSCLLDIELHCHLSGPESWIFQVGDQSNCMSDNSIGVDVNPSSYTCDPFYMLFENIRMDEDVGDNCCDPNEQDGLVDIEFTAP